MTVIRDALSPPTAATLRRLQQAAAASGPQASLTVRIPDADLAPSARHPVPAESRHLLLQPCLEAAGLGALMPRLRLQPEPAAFYAAEAPAAATPAPEAEEPEPEPESESAESRLTHWLHLLAPDRMPEPPLPVLPGLREGLQAWAGADPALFERMQAEAEAVAAYRQRWQVAPWPPVFVTTDLVLLHQGHLLAIKRKAAPGQGLWALPGGYLDGAERLLQGALRELREETGLDLSPSEVRPLIRAQGVFDHPERSSRGRILTHAWAIALPEDAPRPGAEAGDDAADAAWLDLAALPEPQAWFEDHRQILKVLLG